MKEELEAAEGPHEINVAIQLAIDKALETHNEDLVRRILQYNFWCDQSDDPEVVDAAVCGLWSHLFRHSEHARQSTVLTIVEKWLGGQGLKDVYEKHWKGSIPSELAIRFKLEKTGFKGIQGGKA